MGKVAELIADKLIPEVADRQANRIRVYRAPNGEVTIHHRFLKIVLHTPDEIAEWKFGFHEALDNLQKGKYFENDL